MLAAEGWLVSIGIEATAPETGFGYLKRGRAIYPHGFHVDQFVEKPDVERARAFLDAGIYFWNGGIFAFRVRQFLDELQTHRPGILEAVLNSVSQGSEDAHRFHPDPDAFAQVPSESVDYAVMENTARAAMVPADMGWSDVGNWRALHEARPRDSAGNSISGPAELVDCRNVLVDSDGPRVSVIGLEDVIIVVDGTDVLVTSAKGAHEVGKLAGALNQ
jgi:mannose-1-phosphate guanylyltransferase/mannose-1-phosphate guanylyltransferase/mannose-6-phosphate isomerase